MNKKGETYICTYAATNFYTQGKEYELVEGPKNQVGFIADDGLFDVKSVLISKFKQKMKDKNE